MTPFEPEDWDYKFGEWLTLPPKQDKMGTVHTIENHLTAISRTIRRVLVSYSERQNIQKNEN